MSPALAALWGAVVTAARAGTLRQSITDGIALATWALSNPDEFAVLVGIAKSFGFGAESPLSGGSAAVESPAMEHADGSHMGGS